MFFFSFKKVIKVPIKSALILSALVLLSLKLNTPIFAVLYQPGETLNPACSPTETECKVVSLTTPLPPSDGGTGLSSIPTGAVIYGAGSNTFATLSIGTSGQILAVNGTGLPVWTTIAVISPGTVNNNTLRWDGSNWVESGALKNDGTNISTTGQIDLTNHKIVNLATPTSSTDATNKTYVDSLLQGASWQNSVINLATGAAPGSPTTGNRYILQGSASGFGACTPNQVAEWNGSSWDCYAPSQGWSLYVTALGANYNYNGASWGTLGITIDHNTLTNLQGGQTNEYYHLKAADSSNLTTGNPTFAGIKLSVGASSGYVLQSDATGNAAWAAVVGLGTTYNAGVGLTMPSSGIFALNLGSSNTWTGLQTFNATGSPFAVGSTTLVTNLNAQYLNGISSSGFDNYNHWKLQTNSVGTTNILTGNTINFINGVGISLSQTGSNITINNVGVGSSYTSGVGLTLVANTFSLNLGSSNTWSALQTFSSGLNTNTLFIGGTQLSTNINKLNYLSGISATNGSIVVGVGASLGNLSIGISNQALLSNGIIPVWTTVAGLGQTYSAGTGITMPSLGVFSLNLSSPNTWTGLQTFSTTGSPFAVGSTTLVTNLNAQYLNGISSSGFVGIGQTGNFVSIGQTGSLPYVNDTINGTLTRSGTGPYTITLNLGSSNTWSGLQTFSTTGSPFAVGSTNLVTNLNAQYLNGIDSDSLLYVNDSEDNTLTLSGSGPYTLGINLDSFNTWVGTQTFDGVGAPFAVGSTTLVTNLNAQYLNGISSSGFDNYNHWKFQVNGVGTTNILSGNTINFVNGVGMSLVQNGSTVTINDVLASETYTTGAGLTLTTNVFSLDLTHANTWTGLQTFSTTGSPFAVGSTTLVTNLNAQYLNGISSSGFDNYNHWVLQTNGVGTTSVLTNNTVNFINGVGISLSQTGSSITINNVGVGSSYTAGVGLTLVSNTFSLNLGSSNTWTGLQTFSATGSPFAVGSTTLVTNLNAQYLNGISSSGFDNYNHWKFQVNSVGTTNVLSGNTINFINGVGISMVQSGSTITVNNSGVAGATNGLSIISSNVGLGGTLTQNTNIGTSSFGISFLGLGNTQGLYIASSGRVGIGTTAPNAKLNVLGNIQIGTGVGTTAPSYMILDSGTSEPAGSNGAMYYNSSTHKFRCYENSAWKDCITSNTLQTRSFGDTSTVAWADNNTTPLFIGATQPNLTPSSASNKILVMVSIEIANAGTGNVVAISTIRRNIGSTAVCVNPVTNQVDSKLGNFTSDAVKFTTTSVFVDDVSTTNTVYYTLCTDTDSILANAANKTAAIITLIEVNNSNADLAEIYSTSDKTIGAGDVVILDPNLKSGVKRSVKAYDQSLVGVVSSSPAITIGGVDDDGASAVPVALSGRVPVKVSTENGAINAGDFLTSSSVPGVAMKATKAGNIIGQAITPYNGQEIGQVIVFIKNGVSNGAKTSANLSSTEILASLIQQNNNIPPTTVDLSEVVTDRIVANLEIVSPKITIKDLEASGTATFKGLTEFQGPAIFKTLAEFIDTVIFRNRVQFADKDMGGVAIIKESMSEIEIKFEKPYEQIPIVNISLVYEGTDTPTFIEEGKKATIAYLNRDGFKIILPTPAIRDFKYNWIALYIKNAKTFIIEPTPTLTPTPTAIPTTISTPTLVATASATATPTSDIRDLTSDILSPTPTPTIDDLSSTI